VAGTGGKRRAAIEGSGVGGDVAYEDRWTGARVQARLGKQTGGQTGKQTAQIEPKLLIARVKTGS